MTSAPHVADFLARLKSVKPNGKGWQACCPAHDDAHPSLSVSVGNNERILAHCHAGCSETDILGALRVDRQDLFPPQTEAACIEFTRQQVGHGCKHSCTWTYTDRTGREIFKVARFDYEGGKQFRPIHLNGNGGYRLGDPSGKLPLYELPLLNRSAPIWIVEGEKCADAMRRLRFNSTTWAHGASAVRKSDWSTLDGCPEVIALPDNDVPGRRAIDHVAEQLAALAEPPRLKVVDLRELCPDLPEGGDIVDVLSLLDGQTDEQIAERLRALAEKVESVKLQRKAADFARKFIDAEPSRTRHATETEPEPLELLPYSPFPTHLLPQAMRDFVESMADAMNVDPAYLAIPAIATAGGAIGVSRGVILKNSWKEHPIIWACLIARSGSLKSPSLDAATEPLQNVEHDAIRAYALQLEQYQKDLDSYAEAVKRHKQNPEGEPPTKPPEPVPVRYVVSDCTLEALAPILQKNPRGLCLIRDELAAWLKGFGQYKAAGRGGADAHAWLEFWRAGPLKNDRKLNRQHYSIRRAAVSVVGTIPPTTLQSLMTPEFWDSGLGPRLLIARPPERPKVWSDRVPTMAIVDAYADAIGRLTGLAMTQGKYGPQPGYLDLTREAREHWSKWYDAHALRQRRAEDREAAALAKLEAYAARFALIIELFENPDACLVDEHAMQRGCALADWFAAESLRIYSMMAEPDSRQETRKLIEWIERQGGQTTVREVARNLNAYKSKGAAEAALEALVKDGLGIWERPAPGETGGRPTRGFRLQTDHRRNPPSYRRNPPPHAGNEVSSVSVA